MIQSQLIGATPVQSEEYAIYVSSKTAGTGFKVDEKIVAFFQSMIDNLNGAVESIKKLASKKYVIFFKGLSAAVMTPFSIVAIVQTCWTFANYSREKKIDAGLSLCEHFRRIGENAATLVVSLEGMKVIRKSPVAWTKPFAGVLSILSLASIAGNIRTCVKVKRLMREWKQVEESGRQEGKMTLSGYRALLDFIKAKQAQDGDFISEMFNISEDHLNAALSSVEKKAEQEMEQAGELLEKTTRLLKGRIKQNLVSSTVTTISSVINLLGTTLLLLCPALPIGWAIVGITTAMDGSNWLRHKAVDCRFAKAMNVQRTKWEWITC